MSARPVRQAWLRWGAVALIQVALIGAPLAERVTVRLNGREAVLAMRPVDPRDLLRGDYVIINLEIGRIDPATLREPFQVGEYGRVWVVLEPDADGVARPVEILTTPPNDGRLAISGRVLGHSTDSAIFIDYGIDAFYVPEGAGKEIEQVDASRLRLVVAISPDGRSLPLRLLQDGEVVLEDGAL